MNELEFKRHLKDLVHGHHHVEEHDWGPTPARREAAAVEPAVKRRTARKVSRKPAKRR